jgi:hypothetical protein
MINAYESVGGMGIGKGKPEVLQKTCPNVTLFTTNPTQLVCSADIKGSESRGVRMRESHHDSCSAERIVNEITGFRELPLL